MRDYQGLIQEILSHHNVPMTPSLSETVSLAVQLLEAELIEAKEGAGQLDPRAIAGIRLTKLIARLLPPETYRNKAVFDQIKRQILTELSEPALR